jgi:predicted nucleotidyltransferase
MGMGKPVEFHFDQRHPGELALLTVSGSHAYGLAHEASDLDLRGVYVAPGADLFKADLVREQVVLHDPDTTIFELRKFCKLAAAGNPGALEMLWTPPAQIVVASEAWAEMVAVRQAFLSVRVHEAFLSYARSQWEDASRLAAGEEMGGRWKERTRLKHLVHTFRVLEEAEMLFRTGEMKVRVDDAERLRRLAARPRSWRR